MLRPVLGDGLLISEGATWRHQRRTLAPAFTPRAVEMLAPHILAATDAAIPELEMATGDVDLFGVLQRLALEIAGRTMFSVGMARHGAGLRTLVEDYQERLGRPRLLDFLLPPGWPSPHDIARARFRKTWTARLDDIIADRGSGRTGAAQDLLDLLGEARDPETGRAFSRAELRDQVATLILAGHETTALTLLWACTLLARSPGIQATLAAEAHGDRGTGDPMKRLPLTRAVVDETLRLYPPAYILARLAREADTLAGHTIAAGTVVIIAPWLLHRHRMLWQAPDAFDPSRFLPGAPAIPRFAYLPFGAGPRVCIGAQFALTEAVLALSRLVGRFRIALAGDRPVLPAPVVTMQPDHAPAFRLTPRDR
jgi:cytochrome P450